jgi:hypothetical protein
MLNLCERLSELNPKALASKFIIALFYADSLGMDIATFEKKFEINSTFLVNNTNTK